MMHSTTSTTKTSTSACYTLHFALGKHFSGIRAASGPLYPTVSATAVIKTCKRGQKESELERSIATWCGSIHSVRIGLCRICQFHSLKDSRLHVEISPHVEAWSRLQLSLHCCDQVGCGFAGCSAALRTITRKLLRYYAPVSGEAGRPSRVGQSEGQVSKGGGSHRAPRRSGTMPLQFRSSTEHPSNAMEPIQTQRSHV